MTIALRRPHLRVTNLNRREIDLLTQVIDAARREPGMLHVLNKVGRIYTAQHWRCRTRWIVQDCYRNPIADGRSA